MTEAAALDAAGFIAGCGESAAELLQRVERHRQAWAAVNESLASGGKAEYFGVTITADDRIPPEVMTEAGDLTDELYAFRMTEIPGFYLSRGVGMLWGGCLIGDPDESLALLFLRGSFRNRRKWLFYNRQELTAHELCHSARQMISDLSLEEHFAYQTSPSRLRRYLGNCFIRDLDALLFFVPTLILLAAQLCRIFWLRELPISPFWAAALAAPAWLLLRNAAARRCVKKAAAALQSAGVKKASAIMFRCTATELAEIARSVHDRDSLLAYAAPKAEAEVRWQVITERFITPDGEEGS